MKPFLILLALFHAIPDFAQTQREMELAAYENLQTAVSELNAVTEEIKTTYAENTAFIADFELTERTWREFRDAQIQFILPEFYGSYQLCSLTMLTEFTQKRVESLKEWTVGIPEGDVCTGSRSLLDASYVAPDRPESENSTVIAQSNDAREGINGVELGANYQQIRAVLGKPDSILTSMGPYEEIYVVWKFLEPQLELNFDVNYRTDGTIKLTDITATDASSQTAFGTRVGDSFEDFASEYATSIAIYYTNDELNQIRKEESFDIILGLDQGIQFHFENGQITRIFLSSYWGPKC